MSLRRLPLVLTAGFVALVLAGCTASPLGAFARIVGLDPIRIDAISASEGSLAGGESVEITGSGLSDIVAVEVDGTDAPLLAQSNDTVSFAVPHSREYVDGQTVTVAVVDSFGTAAEFDYTYRTLTAVDRQLEYAFAHWDDYNTAYFGDFNAWGGDCQNFVSQTLLARGWTVTDEWFNEAQEDWAPAFVHVPSFDEWLAGHPEYGAVRMGIDRIGEVKIGDVVLFDWEGDGSLDHAQIVSGVESVHGRTEVLMVGHNLDSTYRSIGDALASQGNANARVYLWSIP